MSLKDYYKILEIKFNSEISEIKKAYRLQAIKHHPDKNLNNTESTSKFLDIQEAYETLSNPILKKAYDIKYQSHKSQNNNTVKDNNQKSKYEIVTPEMVLEKTQSIRIQVQNIDSSKINKLVLFSTLQVLLMECSTYVFTYNTDPKIQKKIVTEILACSKSLDREDVDYIIKSLRSFAQLNKELEEDINAFTRKYRITNFFDRNRAVFIILGMVFIVSVVYYLQTDRSYKRPSESKSSNSNLSSEVNSIKPKLTNEQQYQLIKDSLIANGWESKKISNGQLSSCYNFKPTKGNVSNYLEVNVGGGTDVAIKVMNSKTEKCIRYVFINSRSTYTIKNIPDGKYYLKIAYGKEWYSKIDKGQCVGQFLRNPMYEKGLDIMDFNRQRTFDGIITPSFKLSLDIISSDISNSFDSHNISEKEFNL